MIFVVRILAKAKVAHLNASTLGCKNIQSFDVAMYDLMVMHVLQG